jgi:hypothetical protein
MSDIAKLSLEHACAYLLARLRWAGDDGIPRHDCGRPLLQQPSRARCFACHPCHVRRSVTAGTTLEHCKVPLAKVFAIAGALVRPLRTSAKALSEELKLHVETAWNMRHRLLALVAAVPATAEGAPEVSSAPVSVQPPVPHHVPVPKDAPKTLAQRHAAPYSRMHVLRTFGQPPVVLCCEHLPKAIRDETEMEPLLTHAHPAEPDEILDDLIHHAYFVLFGVSGRWLQRYAQFAAKRTWALGKRPFYRLMQLALAAPPRPFDQLRPGATPELDILSGAQLRGLPCVPKAWRREYFDLDLV